LEVIGLLIDDRGSGCANNLILGARTARASHATDNLSILNQRDAAS
jgi:hypothetical protein